MEVAGLILDAYDLTPQDLLADAQSLEKVGALDAERLGPDDLDDLDDSQFGLIGISKTGRKVRRFPIHDADHTKLAAFYFSRHAPKLPPEVAEKVAARIHSACMHYRVPSPLGVRSTLDPLEGIDLSEINAPIDLGAANDVSLGMIRTAAAEAKDDDYAVILQKGDGEKIGLYYLGDRRALKEASVVFSEDGWREIRQPELRVKIADAIAERLRGEGMYVPQRVADYASTDVSPDFEAWVDARRSLVPHEKRAALAELVEKQAEFTGRGLGRALETFDCMAGLDQYWDSGIADPYRSCYGATEVLIKAGRVELRPEDLKKLASNPEKLGRFFDTYGVLEFQRDPEAVFSSLPMDTQEMLAASVTGD